MNEHPYDKLLVHLNQKWGAHKICFICRHAVWRFELSSVPTVKAGPNSEWLCNTDKVLPICALICLGCGNTLFINLMVAGILELTAEALQQDDDKPRTWS